MAILDTAVRRELERTVVSARKLAEQGARKALLRLGADKEQPPGSLPAAELPLFTELSAQRGQLSGFGELVEQCGYEHWHRILFARFLAENDLLIHPEHKVSVSLQDCEDEELQRSSGASDAYELAARYATEMLPAIFRPEDALLRVQLAPEDRLALEKLVKDLPEAVFMADDSLGWTYQFWQKERKEAVNKAERAVEGADICAVTQLFTEHYMVRFLLENTLGAWWLHHHPDSPLGRGWEYYKPDIPHCHAAFPERVEEITLLDPCCGSGHFLVEAFLMFQAIYREQGHSEADAGDAAIRNNLFGLELDPRCTQIAVFNVALAAWRRGGYRALPEFHIACCGLPLKGSSSDWERLAGENDVLRAGMAVLHETFANASDLGSLINPSGMFAVRGAAKAVQMALDGMSARARQNALDLASSAKWEDLAPLLSKAAADEENPERRHAGARARGLAKAAEVLSSRFWFVATNPPFLSVSKAGDTLRAFVGKHHPDAKKDLATCFVERCRAFTVPDGEYALVNPQNWLFMTSDMKLRVKLLKGQRWQAVVRFGPGAFESVSGEVMQACNLIFANRSPTDTDEFFGLDASEPKNGADKAALLREAKVARDSPCTVEDGCD